MKSINRRAIAALVFGFLTLGTGSAFAVETKKAHGCCAGESSCCSEACCSAGCCTDARAAMADNQTEARFKAKHGRE